MRACVCLVCKALQRHDLVEPLLRNELHALVYRARLRGQSVMDSDLEGAVLARVCSAHRRHAAAVLLQVPFPGAREPSRRRAA